MEEFLTDYTSEASMAASPRNEEVGIGAGEETATRPHPGEVDSEPVLEVAISAGVREEEEEDEDHDTYFKRKRRLSSSAISPVASPQKKVKQTARPSGRRWGILQIREVEPSVVDVSPPVVPVIIPLASSVVAPGLNPVAGMSSP